MKELIAQFSDLTPVGIMVCVNGILAASMGALYRDCRKDREKLWEHVRMLEDRITEKQ